MEKNLKKYKEILKEENIDQDKVVEILGITQGAYKNATKPGMKNPPSWVRVFVAAYGIGKNGELTAIE
jgi:hypothetical protein